MIQTLPFRMITLCLMLAGACLLLLTACYSDWIQDTEKELIDINVTIDAKATATEEALATAKYEATALSTQSPPESDAASQVNSNETPSTQFCATEAECSNAGSHIYTVAVTEDSPACGAGAATQIRNNIHFVEGGVTMQVNENAPALYAKIKDNEFSFIVSNGDNNQLIFNLQGFTIMQTKADGSPCLTYNYTRSE